MPNQAAAKAMEDSSDSNSSNRRPSRSSHAMQSHTSTIQHYQHHGADSLDDAEIAGASDAAVTVVGPLPSLLPGVFCTGAQDTFGINAHVVCHFGYHLRTSMWDG